MHGYIFDRTFSLSRFAIDVRTGEWVSGIWEVGTEPRNMNEYKWEFRVANSWDREWNCVSVTSLLPTRRRKDEIIVYSRWPHCMGRYQWRLKNHLESGFTCPPFSAWIESSQEKSYYCTLWKCDFVFHTLSKLNLSITHYEISIWSTAHWAD